jgi:hypothetical protein
MAQPAPPPAENAEMIETASGIAAALKGFRGDHAEHLRLLKQVDKLRILLETPMDVLMKQWKTAQCIAAINFLVEMGVLEAIPNTIISGHAEFISRMAFNALLPSTPFTPVS